MNDTTLAYIIAAVVIGHFLIAFVWLMIKLTKKKK
jgi:hypothetical protein